MTENLSHGQHPKVTSFTWAKKVLFTFVFAPKKEPGTFDVGGKGQPSHVNQERTPWGKGRVFWWKRTPPKFCLRLRWTRFSLWTCHSDVKLDPDVSHWNSAWIC